MQASIRTFSKVVSLALFTLLLVSGLTGCGRSATSASAGSGGATQQRSDDELARWHARNAGAVSDDDELARWHARNAGTAGVTR